MCFVPDAVLWLGFLHHAGLYKQYVPDNEPTKKHQKDFQKIYGCTPSLIAHIWNDLLKQDYIPNKYKTKDGFKRLLMTFHFL